METTQSVNLGELEKKYGTELVEDLKEQIDYAVKEKIHFKVEVVDESTYFAEIAFVTKAYAYIFEVSLGRKKVIYKNQIGWRACEEISKLMNSF